MSDDEYISTPQARALLNVTTQTIRRWANEGKIKFVRTPKGTRRYSKKNIYEILGKDLEVKERQKIIYCRVSSKEQKHDLKRQVKYLQSLYPEYESITDIGSGIDWKRKGFKTILEQVISGNVEEVVVAHEDKLCRFSKKLIKWIFEKNKTKLTILDVEEEQSSDQEIAEDLLSIVQMYSRKYIMKKRYRDKTKNKSEEADEDSE